MAIALKANTGPTNYEITEIPLPSSSFNIDKCFLQVAKKRERDKQIVIMTQLRRTTVYHKFCIQQSTNKNSL